MLTKKAPPRVDDPALARVIQQLYNDINEIIDALGQMRTDIPSHTSGKPGEIAISKEGDAYIVSIRTSDGWVSSASDVFIFQPKVN